MRSQISKIENLKGWPDWSGVWRGAPGSEFPGPRASRAPAARAPTHRVPSLGVHPAGAGSPPRCRSLTIRGAGGGWGDSSCEADGGGQAARTGAPGVPAPPSAPRRGGGARPGRRGGLASRGRCRAGAGGGPRAEPPPSGGARPGAAGRAALRWRRRPRPAHRAPAAPRAPGTSLPTDPRPAGKLRLAARAPAIAPTLLGGQMNTSWLTCGGARRGWGEVWDQKWPF